ncbi:hypothetical protein [Planktothrix sp. FACHB-1365]|uniref:hypothetical protein n=1 Tax=Planktothrix sp. FACHB-1365 TaxID=2692855 RepID=UPI0016873994|nr:hypothetical protein [Planktothrix sp. FACHB-1365]MBD2484761.1 hypothetical protein [Planktothrix sp. FACHB-1365]
MDTSRLVAVLDEAISQDRSLEEKIFLKLLKQVWQVDWTVAPYDVFIHMIEWDIPYFLRFMAIDEGDEAEEQQLIQDWIESRVQLRKKTTGYEWKRQMVALIDEANHLRVAARQE